MKNKEYKNIAFSGAVWLFLERWGVQGVTLLVSIVLARLLDPEAYGTVAIVTSITSLLYVFIDGGMGTALVQKKDADDIDASSLFYINILMCLIIYIGMYFFAPVIADFYDNNQLISLVRVCSLSIIFSAFRTVQQSLALKQYKFRTFFLSTLVGTVISAVIGIFLAFKGFGVWALVAQNLSNNFIGGIVFWFTVKWRPKLVFSFSKIKGLFSFGWKILFTNLFEQAYMEIRSLIIGKIYAAKDLGYYNKGQGWPNLIMTSVVGIIDRVLFPIMAAEQDDKERIIGMLKRSIKTSTYIMAPLLLGIAACSEQLVSVILTDKWLPCVPFMRAFCIGYIFYPICNANLNVLKALGKGDLFLKANIITKVFSVVLLIATAPISVKAMVYSYVLSLIITAIINSSFCKKFLSYGFLKQLKVISPILILSVVMCGLVYAVKFIGLTTPITLIVQIPVGAAVYIAGSLIFKIDTFNYLFTLIFSKLRKNKKSL